MRKLLLVNKRARPIDVTLPEAGAIVRTALQPPHAIAAQTLTLDGFDVAVVTLPAGR